MNPVRALASPHPRAAGVRIAWIAAAVIVLVAIGTAEAAQSARELSELPGRGRPTLGVSGAALTLAGLALSLLVYATLGRLLARGGADQPAALRAGIAVGVLAGGIGGTVRALFVRDYLVETLARYGFPAVFADWAIIVFVAGAVIVSSAGGAAMTWLGFRSARR